MLGLSNDKPSFYCPRCGSASAGGTTFCTRCGVDLRSVPLAIEGRLTTRQRDFVSTMTILASTSLIAVSAATVWAALIGGGFALFCIGRVAFLLARDRKSSDPIFRLPDRASSATNEGASLYSTGPLPQRAMNVEGEDPTRRFK